MRSNWIIFILVCCLSIIPAHAWFVEDIIAIDQSKENNSQKIVKFFVLKKEIYIEQEKTTSERKLNDLAFAQKLLNKKIIYYTNLSKNKKYMRIAHAWGDYKWFTYTNSLDALEQNKKYFRYFELDFSWTKDNKLVCIHDWGGSFKKSFWFSLEWKVPTRKQFMYYVIKNKSYKNCTLDSLVVWLEKNLHHILLWILNHILRNDVLNLPFIVPIHRSSCQTRRLLRNRLLCFQKTMCVSEH